jgi:hypothetical protein
MKRRGNVISPIDSINTIVEMLIQTDFTVEDGEIVWVRSEETLFVYRVNSGLVPDGLDIIASIYGNGVWQRLDVGTGTGQFAFTARNIGPNTNVASLAAFTVAGNDGVNNVQGDVVFLAAQTLPQQNGPYVVGTVNGGLAPLVRPSWWGPGDVLPSGIEVNIGGEGSNWRNTKWASMRTTKSFIIDTDDPQVYPRQFSRTCVLSAGSAFTISNCPMLTAHPGIAITRINAGAGTTTIQYAATVAAGTTGVTPGTLATGSLVISAQLLAGTALANDVGTVQVTISNQEA